MPSEHPLCPGYASGDDYAVEVAGLRFGFSARDFGERVADAALRLGLIARGHLGEGERADLVALAAHGRIAAPASDLAAHVERHRETLLDGERDLVHWLRRLTFRGAWIDAQVVDGRIAPVFDDRRGFVYRIARAGAPDVITDPPVPDWSAVAYGRAAA